MKALEINIPELFSILHIIFLFVNLTFSLYDFKKVVP